MIYFSICFVGCGGGYINNHRMAAIGVVQTELSKNRYFSIFSILSNVCLFDYTKKNTHTHAQELPHGNVACKEEEEEKEGKPKCKSENEREKVSRQNKYKQL
mgnify:CR=1 FL=1